MSVKVMCFKRSDVAEKFSGIPTSYSPNGNRGFALATVHEYGLNNLQRYFIDRQEAEKNPEYLQVIPYIVVGNDKGILRFQRGVKSGEDRLKAKYSIGFGGHIDLEAGKDEDKSMPNVRLILDAIQRELSEELGPLDTDIRPSILNQISWGFSFIIFDDSEEVGSVHLGIYSFAPISAFKGLLNDQNEIASAEPGIVDRLKFLPREKILSSFMGNEVIYENWSQLVIRETMLRAFP